MTIKESLEFLKKEAKLSPNIETCGLLGRKNGDYSVKMLKNKHSDPRNFFSIDPLEFLVFKNQNEIVSIFHSHCIGDSQASEFDVITSENIEVPFLIFSIPENKFNLFEPPFHNCNVKELQSSI